MDGPLKIEDDFVADPERDGVFELNLTWASTEFKHKI